MSIFTITGTYSTTSFETTKDYTDPDSALNIVTSFMLDDSRQYLRSYLTLTEMKILQDMLATSINNFEKHHE